MRSHFKGLILVTGVAAVWGVCQLGGVQAQAQGQQATQIKRETARPLASIEGKDNYAAYCASCHGKTGTGNGPAAPALKVAPTDLTRLAALSGGKFASLKIEQLILGKSKVPPSHGSPDMPIWGPVFHAMSTDTAAESLRVQNLVAYLKSIQAK